MSLSPGDVLAGRFRIVRLLGEGGMGAVYEALQIDLSRRVAIKTIHPEFARDRELVERFRREALAAAPLQHPHIVPTIGFHLEPGESPFLVMELVLGSSLKTTLDAQGSLGVERACRIGLQILDALHVAHTAGVVHRDLKPGNLVLAEAGGTSDFVRLLDFGIAKVIDEDRFTRLTRTGTMLGTPGYMAPEQALGQAIDPRTDLYSLGVVMFRSIAGRLPYVADGAAALLAAVVRDQPLRLSQCVPEIDPRIDALVSRALEKDRGHRFSSAREMQHELSSILARSVPMTETRPSARAVAMPTFALPATVERAPSLSPPVGSAPTPSTRVAPRPSSAKRAAILAVIAIVAAAVSGTVVVLAVPAFEAPIADIPHAQHPTPVVSPSPTPTVVATAPTAPRAPDPVDVAPPADPVDVAPPAEPTESPPLHTPPREGEATRTRPTRALRHEPEASAREGSSSWGFERTSEGTVSAFVVNEQGPSAPQPSGDVGGADEEPTTASVSVVGTLNHDEHQIMPSLRELVPRVVRCCRNRSIGRSVDIDFTTDAAGLVLEARSVDGDVPTSVCFEASLRGAFIPASVALAGTVRARYTLR